MKKKMTVKELRRLIKKSIVNEVDEPFTMSGGSFEYTGGDRALSADQVNTLRRAGFDVANVNPGNLTGEMQSALDWVAGGNNINDWVPEDAMDADQLAAAGADYDVDGNLNDPLKSELNNLVANAAERLSVGQLAEFMLDALSDEMHDGFPIADVISSVESWVHMNTTDGKPVMESNTRWENLAGLLKG